MHFPSHLLAVLLTLAILTFGFAAEDKKQADKKPEPNPPKADAKKDADRKLDDKKEPDKKADAKPVDKKDADKKPEDKKDADKKAAAKPEAKKEAEKKPAPAVRPAVAPRAEQPKPEKVEYGLVFWGRMASVETSQKTFSVAITQNIAEPYFNGRFIAVRIRQQSQNVDLAADDNIRIRMPNPPLDFDDKGKPKKYTAKELKELKGPSGLPGFPGDFDSLKTDQIVRVYLAKTKPSPRPVARKGKDKDADAAALEDKPKVVMIEVLGEIPRR